MATGEYLHSAAWEPEKERLRALEESHDPATIRYLERIGVGPGWTCLEVAAGHGSIATWLAERVGPGGAVAATDLDTRFIEHLARPGLEVIRHDIRREPLPMAHFDLVHARLLLMHLPDREQVFSKLVAATRSGGWLLIEDGDFSSVLSSSPPSAELERCGQAWVRLFENIGADARFGRALLPLLVGAGFEEVGAEGVTNVMEHGTPSVRAAVLSLEYIRDQLVAAGLVEARIVDAAIALLGDPGSGASYSPTIISAWGRRGSSPEPA